MNPYYKHLIQLNNAAKKIFINQHIALMLFLIGIIGFANAEDLCIKNTPEETIICENYCMNKSAESGHNLKEVYNDCLKTHCNKCDPIPTYLAEIPNKK